MPLKQDRVQSFTNLSEASSMETPSSLALRLVAREVHMGTFVPRASKLLQVLSIGVGVYGARSQGANMEKMVDSLDALDLDVLEA